MTMKRKVPLNREYENLNRLSKFQDLLLAIGLLLAVSILLSEYLVQNNETLLFKLNSSNAIISLIYLSTSLVFSYLFNQVENRRRDDLFDNSLNTNLSDENSINYFTNDDIRQGIYKLGINCFENSFHSKFIISKMLSSMVIKSSIILVLYLCLIFFTSSEIILFAFQLVLPLTLIEQTVKLFFFKNYITDVFNKFLLIFTSVDTEKIDDHIIANVIKYETTLSWASTLLSSDYFNKYQKKLANDWNRLKKDKLD